MKRLVKTNTNYLIKQLPKATAYVDLNCQIIIVSDSWSANFGTPLRKNIGSNILEEFPTLGLAWKRDFDKCFLGYAIPAHRGAYLFEEKISWLEWVINPCFDENENIIGAIIQLEDVTENERTKQELEKLQILIKAKSEIAQIGSWEFNAITNELTWSNMTKKIHEVPMDFKPNLKTAIDFYKPGYSQQKIKECVEKSIETGETWSERLELLTFTKKCIWVVASGKPIFENNKFIGLIGTFQDITEEVVAAQKTKENEQLLKTLIDNLPVNIFIKDLDSKKILVNQSEAKFLSVTPEDIIGKDDFAFYDYETATYSRTQDLKVIRTLKPIVDEEHVHVKKDGYKTTFLTSKIPLLDDQNSIKGIVGFSLDISHIKEKEEELRRLIDISNLQNKKLLNFAHIISHNLRSHTANFSMLLGFLIKEKNEIERENLLKMLLNASDNLLETLDNLNEVVAINSNPHVEKSSINVAFAIEKILKRLNRKNKVKVVTDIPEHISVKGKPSYIENILENVVSNALKFSKPEVEHLVEIKALKIKDFIVVSVKDNGSGINLEQHGDKLFGMYKTFHQLPHSRGIGLFIAKNQIEAMKGKFTVKSKVGVGTTFKIFFNEKD